MGFKVFSLIFTLFCLIISVSVPAQSQNNGAAEDENLQTCGKPSKVCSIIPQSGRYLVQYENYLKGRGVVKLTRNHEEVELKVKDCGKELVLNQQGKTFILKQTGVDPEGLSTYFGKVQITDWALIYNLKLRNSQVLDGTITGKGYQRPFWIVYKGAPLPDGRIAVDDPNLPFQTSCDCKKAK